MGVKQNVATGARQVVCAWCGGTIRRGSGGRASASRGMCPRCFARMMADYLARCQNAQAGLKASER